MTIRICVAALLLMTVGLAGCADDTDTTDHESPANHAHPDGQFDELQDAGDTDSSHSSPEEADGSGRDGGPDADARPAPSDADGGESCDPDADCDYDGLNDCEEIDLGTDVCEADTDGDGVIDMQEILEGTDPLDADTDGDGVSDGKELDLGLDPTRRESFDDGIADGDRWLVTACDDPSAEPVKFRRQDAANWRVALPPAFNANYTELRIAGATNTNMRAAAMYDDPSNEVAGFLLSTRAGAYGGPNDALAAYRDQVASLGSLAQRNIGGEFLTHDYHDAAIGQFLVRTSTDQTARQVRESLFGKMTASFAGDVDGFPSTSGSTYSDFRVYVSAIYRRYDDQPDQLLTSVAVAPEEKFRSRERVEFRMNDLTNTTNIAAALAPNRTRCDLYETRDNNNVDFYWVLDQSGSMDEEYAQVLAVANEFYSELNNTSLDYRLGVTGMDANYGGRLRAGWHTDLYTFMNEIDWVIECSERNYTGPDPCNGGREHGLGSARAGIEFMKGISGNPGSERIRADAGLVTIWMSDEEDQAIKDAGGLDNISGQRLLDDFIDFFDRHTVGFSVVGEEDDCAFEHGAAYQKVALGSSGSHASICDSDVSETIEDIVHTAVRLTGYELGRTPISSSLRVYIDGQWVPRSRENGFDYFPETNAVAFFGDYRPKGADYPGDAPDFISVSYETFLGAPKEGSPDAEQ